MKKVINVSGAKIEMLKDLTKKKHDCYMYLDPPYYPTAKTKNGKIIPYKLYNGNDWIPVDFLKLKLRCDELTMAGIPFILSNSDCEFIRILFKDYPIVEVKEPRGMKKGFKKPKETCLLITNFERKDDFMEKIKELNDGKRKT